MNTTSKYTSSFASGALLFSETQAVLPILLLKDSTSLLDKEVQENKILKIKTENGRARVVTELKRRVKQVEPSFWHFYSDRSEAEQKLALLFLTLKAYPLVFDFHFEVVLKKWRMLEYTLDRFDLQMRLDEISSEDSEVAKWTETTQTKLITTYLRMLREAGVLGRTRLRKPEGIQTSFWEYFTSIGEGWFLEAGFLPKTERDNLL